MSTVRDVARRAGVSLKTFSRVLNGDGPVGEQTREAVDTAMRGEPHRSCRMIAGCKPTLSAG